MARRRRRRGRPLRARDVKGFLVLAAIAAVVFAISAFFALATNNPLVAGLVIAGLVAAWVARKRRNEARAAAQAAARRARLLGYDLEDLDGLSGAEFEAWIAEVLQVAGFRTEDIRTSGDFGVDVIAEESGIRFGIQAKRYSSNVGNSAVQEANSGAQFHGCDLAAVVTQAGFTRAAIAQAERSRPPCLLIGRDEIHEMAERLRLAGAARRSHA